MALDQTFWDGWNQSIGDGAGVKGGQPSMLDTIWGGLKKVDPASLMAALPAVGQLLGGGGRSGGNVSQSTNVSSVVNPVISVYNANGPASGSPVNASGGNSSGTASSAAPSYLPTQSSLYGSQLPPGGTYGDITAIQRQNAAAGGIFDDPLILVALAVGGFFLFKEMA